MNLPKVVAELIKAQNNFDSTAYANCFTETAVVSDEGSTYNGKEQIQKWIAQANEKFAALMKPIHFTGTDTIGVLSAEISGTFPGSPLVLHYHLALEDGLIQSLKIKS